VTAATGDYRDQSNPLRDWIDEYCETDPSASVRFAELRDSYIEWSKRERILMPLASRRFADALQEAGYPKDTTTSNVKIRRGLRLVQEGPDF
jgi:phage/plasmid-associated DNA primase